jgi:hypothetical protein
MLSHRKIKAFGLRQAISIIHPKILPQKNLSMSIGSSTQTVSGKSIMRDLQDFETTPDAESKDHGGKPPRRNQARNQKFGLMG